MAEGEVLIILESMKMDIPVETPAADRATEILVVEGAAAAEAQPLLKLDVG